MEKKSLTSWENVEKWYSSLVGEEGHYYHQSLILPNTLHLLKISEKHPLSVLDLGCGQGIFSRVLPKNTTYVGIDASSSLIHQAKHLCKNPHFQFIEADATQKLPLEKKDFDYAIFILSLQNMEHPEKAIENASRHLKKGGKLLIILNHPCFRIPRQSSWGVDPENKMQYRRINRYMSKMKIPIQMNQKKPSPSSLTYSFHHPLSDYVHFLSKNHFSITEMQEWCSDKASTGAKKKMEDRARNEFPLFLAILATHSV